MPKYYEISEETARRAWEAVHMSSYKTGSATAEYRAAVDEAAEIAQRHKEQVSSFYHDRIDALLDAYARKLADWQNAYNRNAASCPSWFISGASNYPLHKHEKQMSREGTLWAEYDEIKKLPDKIRSIGTGPVDLADPHAREILQDQLRDAQKRLDDAKAANAYYRKHKTLDGCPGITKKELEWLTRAGMFNRGDGTALALYGCPFPPYELSSRREKIKRVAARLEELDKRQAIQGSDDETANFDGGQIVRNVELNRLQIVFDEIPDADTRTALKGEGFRWSPKNQAWQRQLTDNAERAARRVLGLA